MHKYITKYHIENYTSITTFYFHKLNHMAIINLTSGLFSSSMIIFVLEQNFIYADFM